jgi:hypothetical protein
MILTFFHAMGQVVRINGAVEITAYLKATELVVVNYLRANIFVNVIINQD